MWKRHAYESHLALRITRCHNISGVTGEVAGVRSQGPTAYVMEISTTGQVVEKEPDAGLVTSNLLANQGEKLADSIIATESAVKNETFPAVLKLTGGLLSLDNTKVCTKSTKLWSWLPLLPTPGFLKCKYIQARYSRLI